jgi:hypothetical protein
MRQRRSQSRHGRKMPRGEKSEEGELKERADEVPLSPLPSLLTLPFLSLPCLAFLWFLEMVVFLCHQLPQVDRIDTNLRLFLLDLNLFTILVAMLMTKQTSLKLKRKSILVPQVHSTAPMFVRLKLIPRYRIDEVIICPLIK